MPLHQQKRTYKNERLFTTDLLLETSNQKNPSRRILSKKEKTNREVESSSEWNRSNLAFFFSLRNCRKNGPVNFSGKEQPQWVKVP
jgi:hypothetical protein